MLIHFVEVYLGECSECHNGMRECSLPFPAGYVPCPIYTLEFRPSHCLWEAKLSCKLGAGEVKYKGLECVIDCSEGKSFGVLVVS